MKINYLCENDLIDWGTANVNVVLLKFLERIKQKF